MRHIPEESRLVKHLGWVIRLPDPPDTDTLFKGSQAFNKSVRCFCMDEHVLELEIDLSHFV